MYNYPIKDYNKDHMARCVGIGLPISRKNSIEICNFIRDKKLAKAKEILKDTINLKKAIPIKRFNKNRGHKKETGPGKYPKKTAKEILQLVENVEANAQFKGLNTADLIIYHISSTKGATQWHYGRQRRRKMKRTNIVIVVKEEKGIKKDKGQESKTKVSASKKQSKNEVSDKIESTQLKKVESSVAKNDVKEIKKQDSKKDKK
jgi:large subunit ribosomal protein L22